MRIFMNVEGAQRVARQMRDAAYRHQTYVRQLQAQLQHLQQYWQGDAPREYVERQYASLQHIQRRVQELLHLVDNLEREIEQYRRVDALDE